MEKFLSGLYLGVSNYLYKHHFETYRRLYFFYKNISDRDKISFLKKNVKKGMTALDLGANIGFYSILLSDLVGKEGKVYSFEPDYLNFRHLKSLTKAHKNISIHNLAVGEKTKYTHLYRSDKLNVDHQTYDSGENRKRVKIKCVALDEFLEGKKIDVIKIDVQGYDFHAIKGMHELISRSKKTVLVGELWPYELKKAGSSSEKYITYLKKSGFNIQVEDKEYTTKEDDKSFYTDFFGIKEKKTH
jgi:FkbM family methyltransferase